MNIILFQDLVLFIKLINDIKKGNGENTWKIKDILIINGNI
jgi:hypothetical protein